jgi:glycosyltransferase involved in cell wall biosynthesis
MEDLYGSSIGSTIKAVELMEHLAQRGHHVYYYWRHGNERIESGQPLKKFFRAPWLRRFFFTPKYLLINILEMIPEWRFMRQTRPHVIVIRLDAYRFSAAVLAWCAHIPLLLEVDGAMSYEWLTFNNTDGNIWKRWLYFFERLCFRLSCYAFVQSNVAKKYYVDLYGFPGDRLHVISNGANVHGSDEKKRLVKNELGIPDRAVVCGFLGSLHYWHGTDTLFQLMTRVLEQFPHVFFLIVGHGGPMAQVFRDHCAGRTWRNRVIFTGHIDHDKVYQTVDIFDIALAPYSGKTLFYYSPVKIFEYMAQGITVLTTRVGQIGEIVRDMDTGVFFSPGDPDDLYQKIEFLIRRPRLRRQIGAKARRAIVAEHTWTQKAIQLEDLLCQCVKENGPDIPDTCKHSFK